jgi:hypothetical protein
VLQFSWHFRTICALRAACWRGCPRSGGSSRGRVARCIRRNRMPSSVTADISWPDRDTEARQPRTGRWMFNIAISSYSCRCKGLGPSSSFWHTSCLSASTPPKSSSCHRLTTAWCCLFPQVFCIISNSRATKTAALLLCGTVLRELWGFAEGNGRQGQRAPSGCQKTKEASQASISRGAISTCAQVSEWVGVVGG